MFVIGYISQCFKDTLQIESFDAFQSTNTEAFTQISYYYTEQLKVLLTALENGCVA